MLKGMGNVKKMNKQSGPLIYAGLRGALREAAVKWNPSLKSGHRMSALGFLAVPGLHTTEQEQPPGHLTVGSN